MTVTEPRAADGDVSAADFRHAIGHFVTGVTVVTSVGADGEPVGTTANAVSSLSLDPPLILVCFDRSSQTLEAVAAHGAFAVNVLGARQQHLSANFARRGLAAALDGVRHRRGHTGSPRLDGVIATLDCTVEHQLSGGDHEIVVGRVRAVETSADDAGPLVFWRGGYASLRLPEPSVRRCPGARPAPSSPRALPLTRETRDDEIVGRPAVPGPAAGPQPAPAQE
jgi:flavin reductase (DIM6/NTAB) family NADH-FMN oxidoreductase RutF